MSIASTALRLGLLGVVAAAALAGFDSVTRDRIQTNERRGTLQRLVDVTGDARLAEMTGAAVPPLTICSASGATLYRVRGWSARGYGGVIQLLLGIDSAGIVTGVRVISHRETPGIGDAVDARHSDWIRSFDGKSTVDGTIDLISGASVSSRAVADGVRDALIDAAATPPQRCTNFLHE